MCANIGHQGKYCTAIGRGTQRHLKRRQVSRSATSTMRCATSTSFRPLTIDRAKGILMKRQGLPEGDAYALLRKAAMDKGLKMADIAQRIVDAADLLM